MKEWVLKKALEIENDLISWRRHLHEHPECSFQEQETAAFVAHILKRIPGMVVRERVGGHGVMHACGHDAHTAMLLGAATLLAEVFLTDKAVGTVHVMFQPAEESMDANQKTGALHFIEAGVYDDVDMAFALHVCPWLPLNAIQLHQGPSMGSLDVFKGVIEGTGGHGAYPHLGTDPIWLLSQVLPVLYSIQSRLISPLASAVLSIGMVTAGKANNVIPSEVYVEGTLRCYDETIRRELQQEIKRAFEITHVFGGKSRCIIEPGEPALVNQQEAVEVVHRVAQHLYPTHAIVDQPYGLGSEDFAHVAKKTKAAMFFLGCKPEEGQYDLHTPTFKIDEACMTKGTALLVSAALAALED